MSSLLNRDHPRVCGEKPFLFYGGSSDSGSPPRMRGKAADVSSAGRTAGITPACAGKRCAKRLPPCRYGDHPRVCGEKHARASSRLFALGSPPRMRGKEVRVPQRSSLFGITPAYAGKRTCLRKGRRVYWDHPRVCGEKLQAQALAMMTQGSPPRMRGKV